MTMIYMSFVPEYMASCTLEVNRDYILRPEAGRDIASERQFIMNGLVLESVLSRPELRAAPSLSNPISADREIRRRLTISSGGGDIFSINYRDREPNHAAMVCSAIADSYLQKRAIAFKSRNAIVSEWLAPSIDYWKKEVDDERRKIGELSQKGLGFNPFKGRNPDGESNLMELRQQLAAIDADMEVTKVRLEKAKNPPEFVLEPTIDPAALQRYVDSDDEIVDIKRVIQNKQNSLASIERKGWEEGYASERYKQLKRDIAEDRATQTKLIEKARERGRAELGVLAKKKVADDLDKVVQVLEAELEDRKPRRAMLAADLENEQNRLGKMAGHTTVLFFAEQDYHRASSMLDQLNHRQAILRTEQGRDNVIQILSKAKPPTYAVEELPYKKVVLGAIAAFLFPLGLALLIELRAKRVVDSESLEASSHLPVLGEISRIRPGTQSAKGRRLFDESVDALRANLFFRLEDEKIRSIAVTSAMPSEGKSSVSSQLAFSLANATGELVLLIDADIRSPDLFRLFGIDYGPGLTKVLSGEIALVDAIQKIEGLVHVLPAGKLKCNPHTLISKKSINELLASVPECYRYIVFDTAPILPAAETLAITAASEATLLCAMRDVSRRDHVIRTQRLLESSGSRLLGTVFSGIPASDYAYRYGDYRYSSGSSV